MTTRARSELMMRELRELRERANAVDAVGLSTLTIDVDQLLALLDEVARKRPIP